MKSMYLIINNETQDINEFISFWSERYLTEQGKSWDNKHYFPNIKSDIFNLENKSLYKLFVWKNGMDFEKHNKINGFNTNIAYRIVELKGTSKEFELDYFFDMYKNWNNIVWKIFLLHCIKPEIYPIYDQHVHRAFDFIKTNKFKENEYYYSSNAISEKFEFYKKDYIGFVKDIKENTKFNLKQIDQALVTFGKFLKDYNIKI